MTSWDWSLNLSAQNGKKMELEQDEIGRYVLHDWLTAKLNLEWVKGNCFYLLMTRLPGVRRWRCTEEQKSTVNSSTRINNSTDKL